MRFPILAAGLLLVVAAVACEAPPPQIVVVTPTPVPGVLMPLPEDGIQYRMSEICQHVRAENYDVKGTLHHNFDADDFSGLLDALPGLARRPVENYIGDGIRVEIEIRDLCGALNQ